MRSISLSLLITALVSVAQPVQAASWVDELTRWFTDLFEGEPAPAVVADDSAAIDSLRNSPLGLMLNEIPRADTLAGIKDWPYVSVNAAADIERYQRLLRRTTLLTNPAGKLPLTADAVRVIYRKGERPQFMLDVLTRFTDVREVAFSNLLPEVLSVSVQVPTIIVANDGLFRGSNPWYLSLADSTANHVTLLHFGDASRLAGLPSNWSVINCPTRTKESETFTAQAIFGAELIDGRLTNTSPQYAAGTGYRLGGNRGGYRLPEQLGIDREAIERADYHINWGIRYRAMPGAQLVVMKDGHVVYEKAYGRQSYRRDPVTNNDLYDLASVTKAASTTLALMKLYDDGLIDLDKRVWAYLPHYRRNLIGQFTLRQFLAHQTGLQPNLPVQQFMGRKFTSDSLSTAFQFPLGPGTYLDSRIPRWVEQSLTGPLEYTKRPSYLYSDLNFYVLQLVVERVSGQSLDQYVSDRFYRPLGLSHLTYLPTNTFPLDRIVPTAHEPWMRGGTLRGFVHDEGAAMLGGVAGHAGLFGNARDLARLFQLVNNGGSLNGVDFLQPETVEQFTERNGYNYRSLGFDRFHGRYGTAAFGAGKGTVGHLGFTGTSVWADPENNLVFVLLTNRISPNPENDKFVKMGIRGRVSREVYRALDTYGVKS